MHKLIKQSFKTQQLFINGELKQATYQANYYLPNGYYAQESLSETPYQTKYTVQQKHESALQALKNASNQMQLYFTKSLPQTIASVSSMPQLYLYYFPYSRQIQYYSKPQQVPAYNFSTTKNSNRNLSQFENHYNKINGVQKSMSANMGKNPGNHTQLNSEAESGDEDYISSLLNRYSEKTGDKMGNPQYKAAQRQPTQEKAETQEQPNLGYHNIDHDLFSGFEAKKKSKGAKEPANPIFNQKSRSTEQQKTDAEPKLKLRTKEQMEAAKQQQLMKEQVRKRENYFKKLEEEKQKELESYRQRYQAQREAQQREERAKRSQQEEFQGYGHTQRKQPAQPKQKIVKTQSEPEPAPQKTASVPFMITRDMKLRLIDRGYTMDDIKKMTPAEANQILEKN